MKRVWGICPYKEMRGRKLRCANLELKLELGRDYDLDQSLFGNSGEGGVKLVTKTRQILSRLD